MGVDSGETNDEQKEIEEKPKRYLDNFYMDGGVLRMHWSAYINMTVVELKYAEGFAESYMKMMAKVEGIIIENIQNGDDTADVKELATFFGISDERFDELYTEHKSDSSKDSSPKL